MLTVQIRGRARRRPCVCARCRACPTTVRPGEGGLPEVEVGEGLEVPQAGGERAHAIVVEAERLQGDEVAQLLGQLAQAVLGQVCEHTHTHAHTHVVNILDTGQRLNRLQTPKEQEIILCF